MRSPDQSLVEAFELSQSIEDERDRSRDLERQLGEMARRSSLDLSSGGSGSGGGGGRSGGGGSRAVQKRYGQGTMPFERRR